MLRINYNIRNSRVMDPPFLSFFININTKLSLHDAKLKLEDHKFFSLWHVN